MSFSFNSFSQLRHSVSNDKLELCINEPKNSISSKYDIAIGIIYKFSVNVVSKKDGSLIEVYTIESYGCIDAISRKALKDLSKESAYIANFIFEITNVYIENFFEIDNCND